MPTLSVIIPTFNEEAFIEDALYSVQFADEIIVIDSFSTDQTVEIVKRYEVKLLQRKFDNFSNQKNHALKEASGDWILFVDADERIPYALQKEILNTLKNPKHAAYKIRFPHFYMNRFLKYHSDSVIRLVKREDAEFSGKVHEKMSFSGNSVGKFKNPMLHFTYKGLHHYITKKESYAWFQAEQLYEKNKKTNWFHLGFKPFYRFYSSYILKGGFRDGIPGLTVAVVNAYGVFQRYVKLMLLHRDMR